MQRQRWNNRPKIIAKVAMIYSLGLPLLVSATNARLAGGETGGHPFIPPNDITSKTCLSCHPSKQEGRSVHSAMNTGCEKCHQTTSQNHQTTVTLPATDGELCAKCHEAASAPVMHAPYKMGQCLVCHNPHSSDFPGQTRAAVNTLCMSCHGANQPNVKIDFNAKTVSLLDGRTITLKTYEEAAKIGDPHPRMGTSSTPSRPQVGMKPQNSDTAVHCLSCHEAHSSQAGHLLRPAS